MEKIWKALAEIAVQPGDTTSGNNVGFIWVTMWAGSREELVDKLKAFLAQSQWELLSLEETEVVDPSSDNGDLLNQMIDETALNRGAIRLGTLHTYKPN